MNLFGAEIKIGEPLYDQLPLSIRQERNKLLDKVLLGERHILESEIEVRGRTEFWRASFNPVETAGKITGVAIIKVDLTELREREMQLRNRESEFRAFFDNLEGAASLLDSEKRFVLFNQKFKDDYKRLTGKEPQIGDLKWENYPQKLMDERDELFDFVLTGNRKVVDLEYEVDSKQLFYRSSFSPVITDGKVTGIATYSIDVTEMIEREVELRKVNHAINERVKELRCLYYVSSIAGDPSKSINEILQDCVNLLPPSYQYPKITTARIWLEDKAVTSKDFEPSEWKQEAEVKIGKTKIGTIEVYYTAKMPNETEGPFLNEERLMLNSVADLLAGAVERIRAENETREQAEVFESMIENSAESILLIAPDYTVLRFNKTAKERLLKNSGKEISRNIDFREFLYPKTKELFYDQFHQALKGAATRTEARSDSHDGNTVWIETKMAPVYTKENNLIGVSLLVENISQRKKAEQEILQLNRLYQYISQISDVILKLPTGESIYREACRIAVEKGRFEMAWICNYDAATDTITPVAWYGNESGYLEEVEANKMKVSTSQIPAARAIKAKAHFYYNDIANDQALPEHVRTAMLKRNYRSGISMPIFIDNQIVAALVLFMPQPFFFNEQEVRLIREITDNITYALDKIRLHEQEQKARAELQESEEKFRSLVEQNLVGVYILQEMHLFM